MEMHSKSTVMVWTNLLEQLAIRNIFFYSSESVTGVTGVEFAMRMHRHWHGSEWYPAPAGAGAG